MQHIIRICTVCHSSSTLEKSTDSKNRLDFRTFGKESRCLIRVIKGDAVISIRLEYRNLCILEFVMPDVFENNGGCQSK